MTLRRIETAQGHRYTLDGLPVQGATTIIGKGVPKPAIPYWALKQAGAYVADNLDTLAALPDRESVIAVVKQSPWTQRDRAAVRGTEVHRYAEEVVLGREVEVPAHLAGYVTACARFLEDFNVEPLVTEVPVASRKWRYAGTLDIVMNCTDPVTGRLVRRIADWKTSSGIYAETAMQLAAYRFAEFYLDGQEERPLPSVDDTGYGVRLAEDGAYYAHPLPVTEWVWKRFLYAAEIAKWQDQAKEIVEEPVYPHDRNEGAA